MELWVLLSQPLQALSCLSLHLTGADGDQGKPGTGSLSLAWKGSVVPDTERTLGTSDPTGGIWQLGSSSRLGVHWANDGFIFKWTPSSLGLADAALVVRQADTPGRKATDVHIVRFLFDFLKAEPYFVSQADC